jgi:hypothetical protein
MAPLRTILRNALLFGLPIASALPQGLPKIIGDILGGSEQESGSGGLGDVAEDIGDAVEGVVSALSNILSNAGADGIIPNRYIVVYNSTFDDDAISASQAFFSTEVKKRNLNKRSIHGHMLSTEVHNYKINSWRATMLDADDDMIIDIFNSPEVEYVEADTKVHLNDIVAQTNAPIGLERLSHTEVGQRGYIFDDKAGEGVTVYVVDTGVMVEHSEFGGRAVFGANFVQTDVSQPGVALGTGSKISKLALTYSICSELTATRMATAATLPVQLVDLPLVSPRTPTSSVSRFWTVRAPVPTLV